MGKKESSRLPNDVTPHNYLLELQPSEDMNSYTGKIEIKASITKATKNIILHSKDLEIKSATICVGTQCLLPMIEKKRKIRNNFIKKYETYSKRRNRNSYRFSGKDN